MTTINTTTATASPSVTNLSDLLTPSKMTSVEYPGFSGFELTLNYLSKDEMLKIRKKSINTKFDRKTRQPVETLDEDRFLEEYTKATIKGWKGFKMSYVAQMLPVDESKLDPTSELPFSVDNAIVLMQQSTEFDNWLAETVNDLANFTKAS